MSHPQSGPATGGPRPETRATVASWVLTHLLAHVAGRGHDATPLRRLPGLRGRDLDDPDTRVADRAAVEAWRLAEAITHDDALGLHLAQAIPAGALDLLEYAFRASETLAAGLEQLCRYSRVMSDRAAMRLALDDDGLRLVFGPAATAAVQRQRSEFALALVVRFAREATGVALAPLEVRFHHRAPDSLFEHRDRLPSLLPCRLMPPASR